VKVSTIKSTWLPKGGYRLDCSPYLGGAIETEILLEQLPVRKDSLGSVTKAIYHAGRESRQWVELPEFGVPFIGSSDIQQADLSNLPLIAKSQVARNHQFLIHKGFTLITRSGTIGKMAYCRPEMDGMACSEHVLRVVPDEKLIPPGYLYAFLSSRFGVPLVVSGTYGSIIQSIEPAHITGLSVPRFGDAIEQEIHELVEEAARFRSEASELRNGARRKVECLLNVELVGPLVTDSVTVQSLDGRLDAHFHRFQSRRARTLLAESPRSVPIGEFCVDVVGPPRGARRKVTDPHVGIGFVSSSAVFHVDPQPDFLVSRSTPGLKDAEIRNTDVLVPRSGSLGGINGRVALPLPSNYGMFGSDHLYHFRCKSHMDACYLWAVLSTSVGYQAVVSTAFGSAIPSLDIGRLKLLKMPLFDEVDRDEITSSVKKSVEFLESANSNDRQAQRILEASMRGS
jgi:type I restriction enzyme, S subunit